MVPISHNVIMLERFPETLHAFKSEEMFPMNIIPTTIRITLTIAHSKQFLGRQKKSLRTR